MKVWKEFEANNLTHSAAHHLMAVFKVREKQGYVRVTDVANFLEITTGSASINLKNLLQKNLIEKDQNRHLLLTTEGEQLAKLVILRKKLITCFLTDILGVSKENAAIDACKTEHLLGMETTEKLKEFIQKQIGKLP